MFDIDINLSKLVVDTLLAIGSIFIASNIFYIFLVLSSHIVLKRNRPSWFSSKPIQNPISLIVPAYNEEKNILESIKSFLKQKYSKFQIIIVNDGSKDDTSGKILSAYNFKELPVDNSKQKLSKTKIHSMFFCEEHNILLINKENGGKSDALNCGIDYSDYEYISCVDADSIIKENAFITMMTEFQNQESLIACGASIRVANGSLVKEGAVQKEGLSEKYIEVCQDLEYTRSFLMGRVGWDLFNSTMIISGAFGVFKKEALIEINGFDPNSIGEDMDLIVRMHKHYLDKNEDYKIGFIPDPLCWTEVPNNFKSLGIQRNRWQRGLLSSILNGSRIFISPDSSFFSKFSIPYYLVTEIIAPILEVMSYLLIVLGLVIGIIDIRIVILFFVVSILFSMVLSLLAILFEESNYSKKNNSEEVLKVFVGALLENFGYRQFMAYQRFKGIIDFYQKKSGWGKIDRTGLGKQ